jgi:hypothetical protein
MQVYIEENAARPQMHGETHASMPRHEPAAQVPGEHGSTEQSAPSVSRKHATDVVVMEVMSGSQRPALQSVRMVVRVATPVSSQVFDALKPPHAPMLSRGGPQGERSETTMHESVVSVDSATQAPERQTRLVRVSTRVPEVGHSTGSGVQAVDVVVVSPQVRPSLGTTQGTSRNESAGIAHSRLTPSQTAVRTV